MNMGYAKYYYDAGGCEERLVFYKTNEKTGHEEIERVDSSKAGNMLTVLFNTGAPVLDGFISDIASLLVSKKGKLPLDMFLVREFEKSDEVEFEISGAKRSKLLQSPPAAIDVKAIHDVLESGINSLCGVHPIFELLKAKGFNWFSWDFDSPLFMSSHILNKYFGENVSESKTLNINFTMSLLQSLILFHGILIRIRKILEICTGRIAFLSEIDAGNVLSLTDAQKHYIYSRYVEDVLECPPMPVVLGMPSVVCEESGDGLPVEQFIAEGESNVAFLKRIVSSVKEKKLKITEAADASNITNVICFCFSKVMLGELLLKNCENCGKFFVPESRSDEIYCQNIFEDGKTCRKVGYENKVKNDKITTMYRTAYKTRHAKMQRNRHIENYKKDVFDTWVEGAKEMREKARSGLITLDEFEKWINEN